MTQISAISHSQNPQYHSSFSTFVAPFTKQHARSQKSTDEQLDIYEYQDRKLEMILNSVNHPNDECQDRFHTNPLNSKYKIQLCRNFMCYGCCPYGDRCQYAHGRGELRYTNGNEVEFNPQLLTSNHKYKTKDCREFLKKGHCPYGQTCNYLHNQKQVKSSQNKEKFIVTDSGFKTIIASVKRQSQVMKFIKKNEKPVFSSGFNY